MKTGMILLLLFTFACGRKNSSGGNDNQCEAKDTRVNRCVSKYSPNYGIRWAQEYCFRQYALVGCN